MPSIPFAFLIGCFGMLALTACTGQPPVPDVRLGHAIVVERRPAELLLAPRPDGTTAEFALTVGDDWQRKGIGRALLERLCACARAAGYHALYGTILADNREMLELAHRLGFTEASRDGTEVTMVRRL